MSDFDPYSLLCDQYKVLGHEGLGYTEIRIPKKGIQIFTQGMEEFVKSALQYCKNDCYVGINPRKNKSGKEEDVSNVTCIVFDFDPVRPKDAPSTDEQHNEAIRIAGEVSRKYDGLLVTSGSGAHVYLPLVPIPIIDHSGAADALRNFGKEIQAKYSTETIKVDSIFDLPRIIRCWGSHNNKSNRNCEFLSGNYKRQQFVLSNYATKHDIAISKPCVSGYATQSAIPITLQSRYDKFILSDARIPRIISGSIRYPSRSESDFAFASFLFKAGFNIEEVKALLPKNSSGKALERNTNDLDREVRRIYDKIKSDIPKQEAKLTAEEYTKDLESRKPGIMTGFAQWDAKTAGLKGGRFYVDAGRPTEGKTTRLVQVAANVAKAGHRVLYFPTECARSSIIDKMLSAEAKVNLKKFQTGDFNADEKGRIQAILPGVLKLPIVVAENFSLKISDIERLVVKESPEYVIVDFLNGMSYDDPNNPSELARVVMGVKLIGKNRNIPLTLAAQLHRKDPKVEDSLSDLKGTGKLEEEGDVISMMKTIDTSCMPAKARLNIMKNKYGEPGIINMEFDRGWCTFKEVEYVPVVQNFRS